MIKIEVKKLVRSNFEHYIVQNLNNEKKIKQQDNFEVLRQIYNNPKILTKKNGRRSRL